MNVMRFYDGQHGFYAGIDLHARRLHLCVLDAKGKVVKDANIAATPDAFLQAIAPFRPDLVVGCECMFAWYWLADTCREQQVAFVLGHAWGMKAAHGSKTKCDRHDAEAIARLLRGGWSQKYSSTERSCCNSTVLGPRHLQRRSSVRPPSR